LTVKNCGRTKAENIAGDFQLIVNNQVLHSLPIKPTNLGAGQAQDITFPRFKNIVSPKTLFDQVLRGEVEMQFYGSYNYRDVFGESGTRGCRGTFRSESNTVTNRSKNLAEIARYTSSQKIHDLHKNYRV
jgi:hypothetical protein